MINLTVVLLFSLIGKIVLHLYLDWKKYKTLDFTPGFVNLKYFFFYTEDVDRKNKIIKLVCNILSIVILGCIVFKLINNSGKNSTEILLEKK